jgi:hypothetical protein
MRPADAVLASLAVSRMMVRLASEIATGGPIRLTEVGARSPN